MREPADYVRTCHEFKDVFGLDFRKFVFQEFLLLQLVAVDVIKFGDWIEAKHYNGYMDGVSIEEAVSIHYGERGQKLIKDLM